MFGALAAPLIGAVGAPLLNKVLGGGSGGGAGGGAAINPLSGDITDLARQIAAVPYQPLPTRRVNAPTKPWESGELYALQQAMDGQYAAQNQPAQQQQGNGQVGIPGISGTGAATTADEWARQQMNINPYAGLGRYNVPLANPNDPFQGMRQGGERGYTSRGEMGRMRMAQPAQRQMLEDAYNRYMTQKTAAPIYSKATPFGG